MTQRGEETPQAEPLIRYGDWQANLTGTVIRLPVFCRNGRVYAKRHKDRAVEETQYGWFLFLETGDGWCKMGGCDFRSATRWLSGEPLMTLDFLSVVWRDAPEEESEPKRKRR